MKKILLLLSTTIAVLYIFSAQILTSYAELFRVDNATKGADAIIILGGNPETRPFHAATLMKKGFAKQVYATQPRHYKKEIAHIIKYEVEYSRDILAEQNLSLIEIPSLKNGATSTFDEAYDTANYIKKHQIRHIILVTDAFHTARAYYAYRKIFELMGIKDILLEISAAPNDFFNKSNWWKTEKGLKNYILEPIKFVFYIFRNKNSTLVQEQ